MSGPLRTLTTDRFGNLIVSIDRLIRDHVGNAYAQVTEWEMLNATGNVMPSTSPSPAAGKLSCSISTEDIEVLRAQGGYNPNIGIVGKNLPRGDVFITPLHPGPGVYYYSSFPPEGFSMSLMTYASIIVQAGGGAWILPQSVVPNQPHHAPIDGGPEPLAPISTLPVDRHPPGHLHFQLTALPDDRQPLANSPSRAGAPRRRHDRSSQNNRDAQKRRSMNQYIETWRHYHHHHHYQPQASQDVDRRSRHAPRTRADESREAPASPQQQARSRSRSPEPIETHSSSPGDAVANPGTKDQRVRRFLASSKWRFMALEAVKGQQDMSEGAERLKKEIEELCVQFKEEVVNNRLFEVADAIKKAADDENPAYSAFLRMLCSEGEDGVDETSEGEASGSKGKGVAKAKAPATQENAGSGDQHTIEDLVARLERLERRKDTLSRLTSPDSEVVYVGDLAGEDEPGVGSSEHAATAAEAS